MNFFSRRRLRKSTPIRSVPTTSDLTRRKAFEVAARLRSNVEIGEDEWSLRNTVRQSSGKL